MFEDLSSLAQIAVGALTFAPVPKPVFNRWCGKYYQVGAPITEFREGLFPYPEVSKTPLLDFQCATASSIYIQGDEYDPPRIIIDTNVTHDIGQPYHGGSSMAQIDVWAGDQYVTGGNVPINTLGNLLDFDLNLAPRQTPYNLTCRAQVNGQTFYSSSTLRYLVPNPHGGSTVKVDRTSGALMVWNDGWERIMPFGFYDAYNQTSAVYGEGFGKGPREDTLSRLRLLAKLGMNMVHPVPPGGSQPYTYDQTARDQFDEWFDTAADLGLGVQYDMRNSYLNLTSVREQAESVRCKSNLLLWYTADEPDGPGDPLTATRAAYDLLYDLDGYHPVSLVLNCENYHFIEYVDGADIIMVDPYSIAVNARWSKPYNTIVTETFGVSGCDGCNGTFYDVSTRVEAARNRARLQGAWRTKPMWIVPQSFDDGQHEFWYRVPTGQEGEAVMTVLGLNHGAMGHASWNSQYSTMDLLNNASSIAALVDKVREFLIDHHDSREEIFADLPYPRENGFDLAKWTAGNRALVLAVNQNYYGPNDGPNYAPTFGLLKYSGKVKEVLYGNVRADAKGRPLFTMGRTSVAAVVLEQ